MEIKQIKSIPVIHQNKKLIKAHDQFSGLIDELKQKSLTNKVISEINNEINQLNIAPPQELKKKFYKSQTRILRLVQKEFNYVPKNYYRNLWMGLGIAAFGIPLGTALGAGLDNMALLGIGMPLGLVIGIAVGTAMDKKAAEENRQLDLDIEM